MVKNLLTSSRRTRRYFSIGPSLYTNFLLGFDLTSCHTLDTRIKTFLQTLYIHISVYGCMDLMCV